MFLKFYSKSLQRTVKCFVDSNGATYPAKDDPVKLVVFGLLCILCKYTLPSVFVLFFGSQSNQIVSKLRPKFEFGKNALLGFADQAHNAGEYASNIKLLRDHS